MSLFSGIKIVSQIPCDLDKILALWYVYLANTYHHCIIPLKFFWTPKKNSTGEMNVTCAFCKKLKKIRQIWPRRSLKHFTAAYRGFPPCTQSQPPINRETGIQQCTTYLRDPVLKQHFFKIKKHPIILQFVFFEFAIHGKLAVESTKNQQVEGSKTKKTKMAFNRTTGRSVNL